MKSGKADVPWFSQEFARMQLQWQYSERDRKLNPAHLPVRIPSSLDGNPQLICLYIMQIQLTNCFHAGP